MDYFLHDSSIYRYSAVTCMLVYGCLLVYMDFLSRSINTQLYTCLYLDVYITSWGFLQISKVVVSAAALLLIFDTTQCDWSLLWFAEDRIWMQLLWYSCLAPRHAHEVQWGVLIWLFRQWVSLTANLSSSSCTVSLSSLFVYKYATVEV